MITLINCAILWAKAALDASYAEAELYGVEPEREDAVRIANLYLVTAAMNHRWMITGQLGPEEYWFTPEPEPTEEECYEADRHMAKRLGEDGPYDNC